MAQEESTFLPSQLLIAWLEQGGKEYTSDCSGDTWPNQNSFVRDPLPPPFSAGRKGWKATSKLMSYFSRAELKEEVQGRVGIKYFYPFSSLGIKAGAPFLAVLQKACHVSITQLKENKRDRKDSAVTSTKGKCIWPFCTVMYSGAPGASEDKLTSSSPERPTMQF